MFIVLDKLKNHQKCWLKLRFLSQSTRFVVLVQTCSFGSYSL